MKRWLIIAAMLCGSAFGSAANVYITPTGTGTCGGFAATGSASFFNNAANWGVGAAQIGQDTIVNLCGVFDNGSNHANQVFTFQGSGASGHPITMFFQPGAVVQAQVCPPDGGGVGNGGCISMFNRAFIVIDGGNSGFATQGSLAGGGTVQNTDNGDGLGHHCGAPASGNTDCLSTLIDGFKCSNCTIKNLKMLNTYVKVLDNVATGVGGDQQHSNTMSGSHITITNNQIPNCGWCVFDNYTNGDTDVNVWGNDISGFGHGMMYATANAGAASLSPALRFYNNNIHDPNNWTTPACNFHNDGLHMFGLLTGTSMDGLYIHDNYFHGTWGHCATGFVYLENGSSNPSHAKNWAVWNNVGDATTETSWANTNGWFGLFSGQSGAQLVANNTLLGGNVSSNDSLAISQQSLSGLTYSNNAISGFENPVQIGNPPVTLTSGNNNFYGNTAVCAHGGNCFIFNGAFKANLAAWKLACKCDAESYLNTVPKLNSDGSPQTGSPVIGAGANLSGLAVGELAGLASDTTLGGTRTPNVRPSATVVSNMDDSDTNWTLCIKPTCDPGGSGTPTSTTRLINQLSPCSGLSNNTTKFQIQGPAFSNVLFGRHTGAQNGVTSFLMDGLYCLDATSSAFQALEYDIHQSVSGILYQWGTECSKGSGFWQLWNGLTQSWVNTTIACSLSTLSVHAITLAVHRVAGETTQCSGQPCMYYDSLTIDGVVHTGLATQPAGPTAFADDTGIDVQLDENGTGTTLTEYADNLSLAYGNGTLAWDAGAYQFTSAGGGNTTKFGSGFATGAVIIGSSSATGTTRIGAP